MHRMELGALVIQPEMLTAFIKELDKFGVSEELLEQDWDIQNHKNAIPKSSGDLFEYSECSLKQSLDSQDEFSVGGLEILERNSGERVIVRFSTERVFRPKQKSQTLIGPRLSLIKFDPQDGKKSFGSISGVSPTNEM